MNVRGCLGMLEPMDEADISARVLRGRTPGVGPHRGRRLAVRAMCAGGTDAYRPAPTQVVTGAAGRPALRTTRATGDAIMNGRACPACRLLFALADRAMTVDGLRDHRACGARVVAAMRAFEEKVRPRSPAPPAKYHTTAPAPTRWPCSASGGCRHRGAHSLWRRDADGRRRRRRRMCTTSLHRSCRVPQAPTAGRISRLSAGRPVSGTQRRHPGRTRPAPGRAHMPRSRDCGAVLRGHRGGGGPGTTHRAAAQQVGRVGEWLPL